MYSINYAAAHFDVRSTDEREREREREPKIFSLFFTSLFFSVKLRRFETHSKYFEISFDHSSNHA